MIKQYQVTLVCTTNTYKPVSAIVFYEQEEDRNLLGEKTHKDKIQLAGIRKICAQRGWGKDDLKKFNYTSCKIRVYDKEKIKAENAIRYEKIKEEKYASGEWKRPKGKNENGG